MSQDYPYLQTVTGIDDGVKVYAIQPISDDATTILHEENPIYAFGPLARINIFVGATNAGKSRFLRILLKVKDRIFLPEELHHTIYRLKTYPTSLASLNEDVHFSIKNNNIYNISQPTHSVLSNMPRWIEEALGGVEPGQNYELIIDASF